MIPVQQTKFGGKHAPDNKKGDCFQAAVASLLEIPLEEAFSVQRYANDHAWFDGFNAWLKSYGLRCVAYDIETGLTPYPSGLGYHLIDVASTTLKGGEWHTVVGFDGKVVYDPNPNATSLGEQKQWLVFQELKSVKEALV